MPIPDCSYVDPTDESRPTGDDFAYCVAAEIRALKGKLPYVGESPPTGTGRLWLDTNTGLWRIKFNDGDSEQWVSPKDMSGGSSGSSGYLRQLVQQPMNSPMLSQLGMTAAHTFGAAPDLLSFYITCVSADQTFSPGYRYFGLPDLISGVWTQSATATAATAKPSTPNSTVRIRDATGSVIVLDQSKWTVTAVMTKFTN